LRRKHQDDEVMDEPEALKEKLLKFSSERELLCATKQIT
jgi:hypothetical protein